jgi:hypothetical protein
MNFRQVPNCIFCKIAAGGGGGNEGDTPVYMVGPGQATAGAKQEDLVGHCRVISRTRPGTWWDQAGVLVG